MIPEGSPATVVVDADGHVVEPRAAWSGAPDHHRPRITADDHGYEHVVVGDTEILAVPLGTLATPGSDFSDPGSFRSLDEALPGGGDPRLRLADMDLEGIDQAVLYPSVGLYLAALDDPDAAVALARSYNDWLADYCRADRTRLFGAAMVPLQDPGAAVTELHRAVEDLGMVAAFVRPNPCRGRSLCHPDHEGLWAAAAELETVVGVHEGSSVVIPTLGSDRPFNPLILHAVSHSFESMLACAQLIAFGVLERHPGLRVVFLESGGGWAPFWLERLDEQAESFGGFCPGMVLAPSEYFRRQCTISYEVDEQTLPALAPFVGAKRIVWGSDYPHHDATFPGAVTALRRTLAPMAVPDQAAVLGTNASALYRLPARRSGPDAVVDRYFSAITRRDGGALAELFTPRAELVAGDTVLRGPGAIRRFYDEGAFCFEDLLPHPGPSTTRGTTVHVPIDLRIAGSHHRVHDVFELEGQRIARLEIQPAP